MRSHPAFRRATLAVAALAAFAAGPARAHDTWFEHAAGTIALGTGNVYPLRETGIAPEFLARHGCRAGAATAPLNALRNEADALLAAAPDAPASCWAQLQPFEVELAPELIAAYLREVRPPQPMLDAWAAMRARGLPWKERYTKHARISLGDGSTAEREPSGMDLDVLVESRTPHRFRVLRDGRPLAGFAVELRHERARFGVWRRTDADGRLEFEPPLAGAWLLRGIDLRRSEDDPDRFESRFVTLAFEAQNGSSSRLNARSASQISASSAIADEPPTSTPR